MSDSQDRSPGPLVTAAVLAASSLTVMANATISPGLPGLEEHFQGIPHIRTLAGLIVTLPSLFVIFAAPVYGRLADRMDRVPLLLFAMAVYAIGGVSGFFLDSLPGILVGRAVLGLGVAGSMTLAITLAGDLWSGRARQKFYGLQASAMSLGGVVFITMGGMLAGMSWRAPFLIYLFAAPAAALIIYAFRGVDSRPDKSATASGADAAPAQSFPWSQVAIVYVIAFTFMTVFYLVPTRLPFLMGEIGIHSPQVMGMAMASMTLMGAFGATLYGFVRRFASALAVFAIGFGLQAAGLWILASADGLGTILPGMIVFGAAMGIMMPNFGTFLMARVPDAVRGRASGMMTTSIFAGQFASPIVAAPLAAMIGLSATFVAFGGILAVAATILAVLAMRDRGAPSAPVPA